MIGYMYQHANVDLFKSRILIEMIARTAKNVLRALWKFTYESEKRIASSSMNRYGPLLCDLFMEFFISSVN
jgi:hypothetical protein